MSRYRKRAVRAINERGILLVYPLQNRKLPASIWSELFPRVKMRWEWDADGDTRVSDVWYLKTELSDSREVVYAKWFQNRATFFSREVFVWMLAYLRDLPDPVGDSRRIYEILEMDSPLSTKQLKEAAEMQGRFFEASYEKAMRTLWKKLWIVGFGEFEDSSFPSLAVGSTRLIFEDLWNESLGILPLEAAVLLEKKLDSTNPFWVFAKKIKRGETRVPSPPRKER